MMLFRSRRRSRISLRAVAATLALCVAAAGTALSVASCRQPPSPPAVAHGSLMPVEYAFFEWKAANEFQRIPEYFTYEELSIFDCVLRSDPRERTGLYLIVGLENARKIPADSYANLLYLRPDKHGIQRQTFVFPKRWQSTAVGELRLGLTGDAWPSSIQRSRPTAWRLTVRAPDGTLLVYRESFLWQLPFDENDLEKPLPAPETEPVPVPETVDESVPDETETDEAEADDEADNADEADEAGVSDETGVPDETGDSARPEENESYGNGSDEDGSDWNEGSWNDGSDGNGIGPAAFGA